MWTFTIREGMAVLRRRADPAEHVPALVGAGRQPDFAGDYSYLFNFIEGGAEKLAGEADTLSGVVADDERDDADRHAVGAVLQLPGRGRLPDVLPDAGGRRRRRRRLRERR